MALNLLTNRYQECHMKRMTFLLFLSLLLTNSLSAFAGAPPEEQEEGEEEEVARIL